MQLGSNPSKPSASDGALNYLEADRLLLAQAARPMGPSQEDLGCGQSVFEAGREDFVIGRNKVVTDRN